MANFFDRFDRPAPTPPEAAGNYFDRFDEPPPPRPAREKMGAVEAGIRGAESGLMFGFSDEASGLKAASGLPEFVQTAFPVASASIGAGRKLAESVAPGMFGTGASERYDAETARARELQRQAGEDQGAAHLAGELGGGVVSAIATPMLTPFRAAQGAGLAARAAAGAGNLAASGALYGAAAGAGAGEGGVVERLPSAATGAAIGAALGPAIGGVVHGGASGARFVADNVRAFRDPAQLADRVIARNVARDGTNLARAADEIAEANTVARPAQLIAPDGSVTELPGSYFVTNGVVHEVAPSGGPGAALGRYREPGREIGGQQLTLADVAGDNTRGLAGNVARLPGEGRTAAREFLDARQIGSETVPSQAERISDRLSVVLGDRGAIETADGIMARRSAAAGPAYERAHSVRLDFDSPDGQRLLGLLERIPAEAKNEANRILSVSDREGSQLIWQPTADGRSFEMAAVPNSRQFDYIKRGLDTMIERNTNPVTGEVNTLGGALVGLKSEILTSLDKLNPAYAAARRQFAGESELLDALRRGQAAMAPSTTPEAVRKMMAGLSPGEAEMFRLGAANALRDKLGNAGDGVDKVRLAYGTPSLRAKVNALAPDREARDTLHGFLRNEGAMFKTRAEATGNSATQSRLADEADLNGAAVGLGAAAVQAGTGHIRQAIRTAFDAMRQVNPELRGRVMNEARKVLFNPDPAAVRAFMARVERTEMKEGTRQRVLSAVARALPGGAVAPATGQ